MNNEEYKLLLKEMAKRMKKKKIKTSTHLTTISPNKKLYSKTYYDKDKYLSMNETEDPNSSKEEFKISIPLRNSSEIDKELIYRIKKLGIKMKKKKNTEVQCNMKYDNTVVHTPKRSYNKTNDCFELLSDYTDPQINSHNDFAATSTDTEYVLVKSSKKKIKKRKRKSKMETNDTVSSKEAAKHKHKDTTKSDYLENNIIPEDRSKEMYNDTVMLNTRYNYSRNSKAVVENTLLFHKLLKKKKKQKKYNIKDVAHVEILSPKKHKNQKTHNDGCSENNISRSVNDDKKTYNGKGHACKYNKKSECNICGRSFSTKKTLISHYRTHTGERPYACNICDRSFSLNGNLVTHYRTHTGERPYACNICDRSFSRKHHLVAHKKTHTGERPYACNICDRSFSLNGNLVTHYRTHTGERPYACNICDRSFSRKGILVEHHRLHTGERPYECGLCEKKFIRSSARTSHTRRKHVQCF
ncbi:hypothetical protein ACI65C_000682 [Semiaphis heraclei]